MCIYIYICVVCIIYIYIYNMTFLLEISCPTVPSIVLEHARRPFFKIFGKNSKFTSFERLKIWKFIFDFSKTNAKRDFMQDAPVASRSLTRGPLMKKNIILKKGRFHARQRDLGPLGPWALGTLGLWDLGKRLFEK